MFIVLGIRFVLWNSYSLQWLQLFLICKKKLWNLFVSIHFLCCNYLLSPRKLLYCFVFNNYTILEVVVLSWLHLLHRYWDLLNSDFQRKSEFTVIQVIYIELIFVPSSDILMVGESSDEPVHQNVTWWNKYQFNIWLVSKWTCQSKLQIVQSWPIGWNGQTCWTSFTRSNVPTAMLHIPFSNRCAYGCWTNDV